MKKVSSKIGITLLIILVLLFGVLYFFLNTHYMPNSVLNYGFNEIEVGLKSYENVVDIIIEDLKNYNYNLVTSDGIEYPLNILDVCEEINREDIVSILQEEKEKNKITAQSFVINIKDVIHFEKNNINEIIIELKEISNDNLIESKDAYITYDEEKKEYVIIPEVIGNIIVEDALDKLYNEISSYNFDLNLLDLGIYKMPLVLKDNSNLLSNFDIYKKYEDFNLTYSFVNTQEVIDISVWNKWIIPQYSEENYELLDSEFPFVLDEHRVEEYVVNLNKKYTTYGMTRTFTTSTGEVLEISKGDYGWILDRTKMIEDINNHFYNLNSEIKEAIFKQRAVCYGENDFKDSYVEVSIEHQRVWMYVDGECIVDTPVVTGNVSAGHDTRKGVFSLTYKTRNATLRGADYASFVYYWMPFDGGIGLHDATWRYSFGGNIYKTNGSHGCVNMPLEAAKTVYNNLESNMPIIVW